MAAVKASGDTASFAIGCGPAFIFAKIARLPADGPAGVAAGGVGGNGTDLHVRVELSSDGPPEIESPGANHNIVIEFDLQGPTLLLPSNGTVYITGGAGNYAWIFRKAKPYGGPYVAAWRALSRNLLRGGSFTVTEGHTEIGSLNAGVTVTIDGIPCLLDGASKPVHAGNVVTASADVIVFTRGLL